MGLGLGLGLGLELVHFSAAARAVLARSHLRVSKG